MTVSVLNTETLFEEHLRRVFEKAFKLQERQGLMALRWREGLIAESLRACGWGLKDCSPFMGVTVMRGIAGEIERAEGLKAMLNGQLVKKRP